MAKRRTWRRTLQPDDLACAGLDLSAIDPSRGAKYSPNLFAWLTVTRQGRLTPRARLSGLYSDSAGSLWIGYTRDSAGFVGQRLALVLEAGAGAGIGAWRHIGRVQPWIGFWSRYTAIGRCTFDPKHVDASVYGEHRWSRSGDTRTCRWCGVASQRLARWTEVQECEAWLTADSRQEPEGPT
jgi:hypothetical protein